MTKILVCGFGSIGRKHAHNLRSLGAEIKIWRKRKDQIEEILKEGFTHELSFNSGLSWCDGVVIATSTNEHITLALKTAKAKKAIYIEKPVSHDKKGVKKLLRESNGLVVEIGCQLRKHPNLIALHECLKNHKDGNILAFQAWAGQCLDQWRPGTDYRSSYSAYSSKGGGALFDLVHEIDLMTWLVGSMDNVYADLRHNSDLEIHAEDLANLLLVAKTGAAGTIQLDMLSPAYRRGLQIICEKAVYHWDMSEGKLWRDDGKSTCINEVPLDYQPVQMIVDTIAHFLERIQNPSLQPNCSLEEGIHDLYILLAARKANRTGKRQNLRQSLRTRE